VTVLRHDATPTRRNTTTTSVDATFGGIWRHPWLRFSRASSWLCRSRLDPGGPRPPPRAFLRPGALRAACSAGQLARPGHQSQLPQRARLPAPADHGQALGRRQGRSAGPGAGDRLPGSSGQPRVQAHRPRTRGSPSPGPAPRLDGSHIAWIPPMTPARARSQRRAR